MHDDYGEPIISKRPINLIYNYNKCYCFKQLLLEWISVIIDAVDKLKC